MNPSPSPSPSPSSSAGPLTTLDYAQHVSGNSDIALVVLIVCGALVLISLGILVSRSLA